ncbi:MAG: hypothetical protein JXR07_19950 [Reichenbachiella sp.]
MRKIGVTVHLVDDEAAPYQLEIEHGDVVILDHVTKMEDADDALLEAISAMKEAYEPGKVPEVLSAKEYEFEYKYDIHALLSKFSGILTQSIMARISGMNKSLLSQYLSTTEPRILSEKQARRIEDSLHEFGRELQRVKLEV